MLASGYPNRFQADSDKWNLRRRVTPLVDWHAIPPTNSRAPRHKFESPGKTLLLVDGYNLAFREWFHPGKDVESLSHAAVRALRETVAALILATCSVFPNCFGRIYFDGPLYDRVVYGPGVDLIYSGGTGLNRADKLILCDIEAHRRFPQYEAIAVVTDDGWLKSEAMSLGARVLGTAEFSNLLKRTVAA